MVDLQRAMRVYNATQGGPYCSEEQHTADGLRRDVWRCLVENADDDGTVCLSHAQIAAKIAADTFRRPAGRASIVAALRHLRHAGLLIADEMNVSDGGNRYRLCRAALGKAPERQPPQPRRPARNPRLAAFDRRAVGWSETQRRVWRCIWVIVVHSAALDGRVAVNVGALADRASDRLGHDIGDDTVARFLRWSVMTRLASLVHHGETAVYQLHTDDTAAVGQPPAPPSVEKPTATRSHEAVTANGSTAPADQL